MKDDIRFEILQLEKEKNGCIKDINEKFDAHIKALQLLCEQDNGHEYRDEFNCFPAMTMYSKRRELCIYCGKEKD